METTALDLAASLTASTPPGTIIDSRATCARAVMTIEGLDVHYRPGSSDEHVLREVITTRTYRKPTLRFDVDRERRTAEGIVVARRRRDADGGLRRE